MNLLHSWKIYCLILIGYWLHKHLNSSCGKNLSWYSSMGVWLMIALEALAYKELEWPKNFSYSPFLEYKDSIGFKSSSRRFKKYFSLLLEAWNVIFQLLRILSHSFFLSNFHKDLQGKIRTRSKFFISLLTIVWRVCLSWLGQFQNLIKLLWSLLKNFLSSSDITVDWIWYKWTNESKIHFAAYKESVMMIMWFILSNWVAWLIPHLIANSSASVEIMLTAWWIVLITGSL